MPFPLSQWKLNNYLFQQSSLFSLRSLYQQSIFNCQMRHVYMQGDVAHNMYPILAIYQRILNQLIQILH